MLWITLVLFIVGEAVAGETIAGACLRVKPVLNLNITRFLGTWYEADGYNNLFEFAAKCMTTDFTLIRNGLMRISTRQTSTKTDKVTKIDGTAKLIGKPGSGRFAVTYPSLRIPSEIPYSILGTNYVDWAASWSCSGAGTISNYRSVWIFTRYQNPPDSVLEEAYKVLENNKISRANFHKIDQQNCPKSN